MEFEVLDKRKRLIKFKVPCNLDLICQRERYKISLKESEDFRDEETEIGFYVESLEANEWLIVDSKCSNNYEADKLCDCKVGTLMEAVEHVSKSNKFLMARIHLDSIFQVSSHLKSYYSSIGYGDYLEGICPACLLENGGHEERLLDLLNVKVDELREFYMKYSGDRSSRNGFI